MKTLIRGIMAGFVIGCLALIACANTPRATKVALCNAGCAVAQLGTSYGCTKIDAEDHPEEHQLCLDGKAVIDPVCLAGCQAIPEDEE